VTQPNRARERNRTLGLLLVLGLALRGGGLWLLRDAPLAAEGQVNDLEAAKLLEDGQSDYYWPPAVPAYLAVTYRLFGRSIPAARAAMIPPYCLLSLVVYLLTARVSNRRAANMAVLLLAVLPSSIFLSISPQPYLLTGLLVVAAAYLTLLARDRLAGLFSAVAGLLLGLAALAQPFAALLAAGWPVLVWARWKRLAGGAAMLAAAALVVGLWCARIYRRTGRFTFINYGVSKEIFLGNCGWTPLYKTWWLTSDRQGEEGFNDFEALANQIEKHDFPTQAQLFREHAYRHVWARPDLFACRVASRIRVFLASHTLTGAVLVKTAGFGRADYGVLALDALLYFVVVFGAVLFFFLEPAGARSPDARYLLLGMMVLFAVPYWLIFAHANHHLPLVPLLCVLAGISFARLLGDRREAWRGCISTRRRKLLLAGVGFVFAAIEVEWIAIVLLT